MISLQSQGGIHMIRKLITIDEEKCNGCGRCAAACHEGAIGILGGKAKLLREDYCDGLGDCLPACPMNAISFEEREAPAYHEAAVLAVKALAENIKAMKAPGQAPAGGCPGTLSRKISHEPQPDASGAVPGRLQNFPVQIKLVPTFGPVFEDADLLIAADCTAYACGDFHSRFIKGKTTLIGCPKLDEGDYADKLTQILRQNPIRSVTLVRMQVPCCGGLTRALQTAMSRSGKHIPMETYIITPEGTIL